MSTQTDAYKVEAVGASTSLRFITNATERMRIDSSGNVGIACTPDTALNAFGYTVLEVAGANTNKSGAFLLSNSAGTDFGQIYADDTAGWKFVNAQTTKSTIFYGGASTSEQMRIDSSGNVGIGTTSPAVALHVVRDGNNSRFEASSGDAVVFIKRADSSGSVDYGTLAFEHSTGYAGALPLAARVAATQTLFLSRA